MNRSNRLLIPALGLIFAFLDGAVAQDAAAPPAPAWVAGYRVRFPLKLQGDLAKKPSESVVARLPVAGWLRPDGSDIAVQRQNGELVPVRVLSHMPDGDTLIQFARHGDEPMYWAYGGNATAAPADGPAFAEGLTVEFRDWAGDSIASWPEVVAGLKQSTTVTGNAFCDLVAQNANGGRPDSHRMFTASYRGTLKITEAGVYSFFVGAEDAAFLFVDGERVFEQVGTHRFTIRFPASAWVDLNLTAGAHSFEIHHVCGADATASNCSLYWKRAAAGGLAEIKPNFVPGEQFPRPTLAEVVGMEGENGMPAATFAWGVDDTLTTPGINLYLARFEAQGGVADENQIEWDFGDGSTGRGRSVSHLYFEPGAYAVTMKAGPSQPAIARRIYMWAAPAPTSPFSLAQAIDLLSATDWKKWDAQRVNSLFDFLAVSEQPNRWPMVEQVSRHLLTDQGIDVRRRVSLLTILMEALAQQGRGAESMKLVDEALTVAGRLNSLKALVLLKAADIRWQHLKEYDEASRLYEKITAEYGGLDVPEVRTAAIHWGDLHTHAGDLTAAEERYRLAKTLGGERFRATGQTEAIQRGAQLRVAEQRLKSGDIRGTRVLLEKMEMDFPEQKLEGLYRLLRAEADRFAGRYEEAQQHYEVLLKLRQWAGLRDRAIHGLADCAYRMEDFEQSLVWFDQLRDSFPEYYETQKLSAFHELAKTRAEALKAGGADDPANARFRGFETAFEPGEKDPGQLLRLTAEPMLGFDGPNVGLLSYGGGNTVVKELKQVQAGTNLWVECWYREQAQSRESVSWASATISIYSEPLAEALKPTTKAADQVLLPLQRGYGQWRKVATLLKVPMTRDAVVKVALLNVQGTNVIDRVRILPVTERQLDALRTFIETDIVE
jgi:tetratricopeptide (TPR) repeat protein